MEAEKCSIFLILKSKTCASFFPLASASKRVDDVCRVYVEQDHPWPPLLGLVPVDDPLLGPLRLRGRLRRLGSGGGPRLTLPGPLPLHLVLRYGRGAVAVVQGLPARERAKVVCLFVSLYYELSAE